jgi:hypothetical protein
MKLESIDYQIDGDGNIHFSVMVGLIAADKRVATFWLMCAVCVLNFVNMVGSVQLRARLAKYEAKSAQQAMPQSPQKPSLQPPAKIAAVLSSADVALRGE